jgi:hypothetical protein
MELKATLETIDELPQELRDLYTETDNGYRLKLLQDYVPADKVEDVGGLKNALTQERENRKKFERKLRDMEQRYGDIDLNQYQKLVEEHERMEQEKLERKGEYDKLLQQVKDQHAKELADRESQASALRKALDRNLVDREAALVCNELKGNATLLMPHIRSLTKVVEEDGEFSVRVVDAAGDPRVNGEGQPLSIKELVSEMRSQDTYAGAFAGSGSSGGGTPPDGAGAGKDTGDGAGGAAIGDLHRGKMDVAAKTEFITEHGLDAYMKLPE